MLTRDSSLAFIDAVGNTAAATELLTSIQDPFQDSANFLFSAAGNVSMALGQKVLIVKKATGAATTVTLPASPVQFQTATIIDAKGDAGTNNITIQCSPTTIHINGATSFVVRTNYGCVRLLWNATEWNVIDAAGTALTTDLTVSGLVYESAANAVSPFATGGQASATALTKQVNRVTTVTTAGDSVALPASAAGLLITVINDAAANGLAVFPASGDAINALSANASITVPAKTVGLFSCAVAGQWNELLLEAPGGIVLAANHVLVGAASGQAADVALSGDAGIVSSGAITVTGVNGAATSATGTELTTLHSVTAGTVAASKAVVVDANKAHDTVRATVEQTVGGTAIPGGATVQQCITKAQGSFADTVATAMFTVTVPNAAHAAVIELDLVGVLGAGGSIGAGESSRNVKYQVTLARTAGVATVATVSAAIGGAAATVAGGQAITSVVVTVSTMTGAVSVTQTFTINVAITRAGSTATNHTCFATCYTLNANASGVTIV